MKLKTLIVSVIVLAALSAVVFFARRPTPPAAADARLNQPLVDQSTIEKTATIRLSDQGKTVTLARDADGTWRVPDYHGLPADFQKLSGFIGNLTDAKLQRQVTTNPERIARLEFKDAKIELLDAAGQSLWSVSLGKQADTGGGRYVRFGDEPKAFLANLNAWLDPEAKNWARTELLTLKADEVARVELPFAEGGPVTVSRAKKEDPWTAEPTPANRKLKADRISTTLSTLGNLRFSDTANLDDPNVLAAKAHLRSFKLTTFDGKTITVALGRKPEEKKPKPATPPAAPDAEKKDDAGKGDSVASGAASATETSAGKTDDSPAGAETKPAEPEFETIPAGPVFAFITHSDASAPINALMAKRAFQVADYVFTSLPQKREELFEPAPPPAAPATPPAPSPAAETPAPAAPEKQPQP